MYVYAHGPRDGDGPGSKDVSRDGSGPGGFSREGHTSEFVPEKEERIEGILEIDTMLCFFFFFLSSPFLDMVICA